MKFFHYLDHSFCTVIITTFKFRIQLEWRSNKFFARSISSNNLQDAVSIEKSISSFSNSANSLLLSVLDRFFAIHRRNHHPEIFAWFWVCHQHKVVVFSQGNSLSYLLFLPTDHYKFNTRMSKKKIVWILLHLTKVRFHLELPE